MVDKNKQAEDVINNVVKKINASFEANAGWGKAMQIVFADINTGYWIKLDMDGHVEKCEKAIKEKESAIVLSYDAVQTFVDMLNKIISSKAAMSTGKLKVNGELQDLLKLSLLLG